MIAPVGSVLSPQLAKKIRRTSRLLHGTRDYTTKREPAFDAPIDYNPVTPWTFDAAAQPAFGTAWQEFPTAAVYGQTPPFIRSVPRRLGDVFSSSSRSEQFPTAMHWTVIGPDGVNSRQQPTGGAGEYQSGNFVIALVDDVDIKPGDYIGPMPNQWYMSAASIQSGWFRFLGVINKKEKLVLARRVLTNAFLFVVAPEGGIAGTIQSTGMVVSSELCEVMELNGDGDLWLPPESERLTPKRCFNFLEPTVLSTGRRFGGAMFVDGFWWIVSGDCDSADFAEGFDLGFK